jgi:hypothetical protein
LAFGVSLYYAIRGVVIQRHHVANENHVNVSQHLEPWSRKEFIFVHCIQDAIYNFVGSLTGFAALYVECRMFLAIQDLSKIEAGTGIFLAFLSILSVVGIGGILPPILLHGKLFGKN